MFSDMKTAQFAVASYASIMAGAEVSRMLAGSDWTVWYLGNDYARLLELRTILPRGTRFAPVGERVAAAAQSLLPLVLDLDGALAEPGFDRDAWDASDLADRSRYNSPFFLELCRAMALFDGAGPERRLAITDDDSFGLALWDVSLATGQPALWLGSSRFSIRQRDTISQTIGSMRRALGDLRAGLRRLRTLRSLRTRSPLQSDRIRAVDVWITVWATDKTFTPHAALEQEERMGRLPSLLRDASLRIGYFVLPLWPERYSEIVGAALQSTEPVLLVEDGTRLWDFLSAIAAVLWPLPGVSRRLAWKGVDLAPVLKRALRRERLTGRPVKARSVAALPRLLADHGASPKTVVTTYENHSWEKVLIGALRRHLPRTRSVGYNHASCPPLYISLNPSPGDISSNHIPDCVLTMGVAGVEALASRGFPAERLKVAGGLRFEGFLEKARSLPPPPASAVRAALCCVAVDLEEGVELVHKSAEAVAGVNELCLLVNFHPISSPQFREQLKAMLRARNTPDFDRIRFDDRPVRALLAEVHAVLYIDSNAALEAAAAGRQTIYVMRDTGLDYDKMPPGLSQRCRTAQEIRQALLTGSYHTADEMRALLQNLIAPVDRATVASLAA
jgi:hypothetical protein